MKVWGRLVGVLLAVGMTAACDETRGISPEGEVPDAPRALEVRQVAGAVTLTWEHGPNWTGERFRIYEKTASEREYLAIAEVTTCSEGVCTFTDVDAAAGVDHDYHVVAVGEDGVESHSSGALRVFVPEPAPAPAAPGVDPTARPDFTGAVVYDFFARPDFAGFRFREDADADPRVSGNDAARHFRVEVDEGGWWLVPGEGVSVYPQGFLTTALSCGADADPDCVALAEAPPTGYIPVTVGLALGTTYVLRVPGDDGLERYGAIRVEALEFDAAGDAFAVFDWVWQLKPGDLTLTRASTSRIAEG
ncbi:MAG: hypothetical protein RQ745_04925 [Longimicrobiales bacterium]|nr:hypothetical protein [Longimicrobiales bacterium]